MTRHRRPQPEDCLGFYLGDAGEVNTHHFSDFPQSEFFKEVEGEDGLLHFGNVVNRAGYQLFQFGTFELEGGRSLIARRNVFEESRSFVLISNEVDFPDVERFHIGEFLPVFLKGQVQFCGDFGFFRSAAEALLGAPEGSFELTGLAAFEARRPIGLAEAVENGAADAELGVGFEPYVLAGVEIIDGVDEPDDAGREKIVEADGFGHPLVNFAGNQAHLRHVFEDELFALVLQQGFSREIICGGRQGFVLLLSVFVLLRLPVL